MMDTDLADLESAKLNIESARLSYQRILERYTANDQLTKAVLTQDARLRDTLAGMRTLIKIQKGEI